MAKRLIQKKISYYKTLLSEKNGFLKKLQIKFWIWNEECKLKKYK